MKILIVDDTALNISALTYILELAGYSEVFSAMTCDKAVLLFNEIIFDWIILDCMLLAGKPGFIDKILTSSAYTFGLDLMRYFRSKSETVNIVLFTGAENSSRILKTVQEQNVFYISKLDSPDKIIKLIESSTL